jgi:hypothetical protein
LTCLKTGSRIEIDEQTPKPIGWFGVRFLRKEGSMKAGLKISAFFILLFLLSAFPAQAKLKGYTYPYDISQVEWEILNWTAAYRGTVTYTAPFVLERMQYDRNTAKIVVYVTGQSAQASDENLKKSIDNLTKLFSQRLSKFEAPADLVVYYKLKQTGAAGMKYKIYEDGSFSSRDALPEEPVSEPNYPHPAPPATSF